MSLRVTALLAMLAAGLVLATSAGAGSGTVSAPRALDLSTMKEIKSYLRSIGVNPKSVVIQRGKKNYAGPNCPGKGWNCTNGTTRVLQIGTQNSADCVNGVPVGACVGVIQPGPGRNTFRCVWRTSASPQRCSVTQTGAWNYASFQMVADQTSNIETAQDATQIVEVHQEGTGLSPKNELHAHQRIKQSITTPDDQSQEGHQVVKPATGFANIQDASGAGNNYADVHQYIDQRASGAADTQEQNILPPTDPMATDCVPTSFVLPSTPNQCVEGSQNTGAGGQNHSQVHQLIDQDAKSTLDAVQTQGHETGGIDARVHQVVGGGTALTGSSNSQAHQAMRQNVAGAFGSEQFQFDPTRCCGVSQQGGMQNRQEQHAGGSQKSDANNSEQLLILIGECNTMNGSCFVTHQARNDEDHANFKCGSANDPCPPTPPGAITHCESTDFGGEGTGRCDTPDDTTCVECFIFTESSLLPGTPLSGFEVTMGLVAPDLSFFP